MRADLMETMMAACLVGHSVEWMEPLWVGKKAAPMELRWAEKMDAWKAGWMELPSAEHLVSLKVDSMAQHLAGQWGFYSAGWRAQMKVGKTADLRAGRLAAYWVGKTADHWECCWVDLMDSRSAAGKANLMAALRASQ